MADDDAHAGREKSLAALAAAGYVKKPATRKRPDPANRAQAQTMPTHFVRAVLDWLVAHRYVRAGDERLATRRLLARLPYAGARDVGVIPVIGRISGLDARRRASLARRGKGVLLGLSAIGAVVAAGVLVYSGRLAPPPVPACDARSTNDALMRAAIQMSYPGMADNPLPQDSISAGDYTVSFSDRTQVGYDRENDRRGCTAFIDIAGQNTHDKTGYEITHVQNSSDLAVQILPRDFVEARYSATGLNKKLGAPVGRDAMRKALIAALGGSDINGNMYCPSCAQSGSDAGSDGNDDSMQTPFATRPITPASRIMQVHPVADCRKLNANQYACPVQVEYLSSRAYAGIGLPSPGEDAVLLRSEFVFEHMENVSGEGSNNGWRMADGFENAFAKAIEENTRASDAKDKPMDDAIR